MYLSKCTSMTYSRVSTVFLYKTFFSVLFKIFDLVQYYSYVYVIAIYCSRFIMLLIHWIHFCCYSLIVRNPMRWCSVTRVTSVSTRPVMASRTFQLVVGFVIHAARASIIVSVFCVLFQVVQWKEQSKLWQYCTCVNF